MDLSIIPTSIRLYTEPSEREKIVHEIQDCGSASTAVEAVHLLSLILCRTKPSDREEMKKTVAKYWRLEPIRGGKS